MKKAQRPITDCLKKLDQIENDFSNSPHTLTLEVLFQTGILTGCDSVVAGDFNLTTWSHSSDGSFSVGALERVRQNGEAFPRHEHEQRLWLLCSKGSVKLDTDGQTIELKTGEYTVVEPKTPHLIKAETTECVVLMVTIPADPGLHCNHARKQ